MKLDASDLTDLRPLLDMVVRSTIEQIQGDESKLPTGRIGFTEKEAAALIGVQSYVLGDARRRGEIEARKVGKQFIYSREVLLQFLRDGGKG